MLLDSMDWWYITIPIQFKIPFFWGGGGACTKREVWQPKIKKVHFVNLGGDGLADAYM